MQIKSKKHSGAHEIAFCLTDSIQWKRKGVNKSFFLESDESCISPEEQYSCIFDIHGGQRFSGLNIRFESELFAEFDKKFVKNKYGIFSCKKDCDLRKFKTTPSIKLIIKQIIDCSYNEPLKSIYLEAKTLELIAIYLNELIYQKDGYEQVKLSYLDIKSLNEAKEILDKNIVNPPSLKSLSKMACINEYKLKTGFKKVFGKPVYTYVKNKRMEEARYLFEEKKLLVSEVAGLVGYTNISHFSSAFKKKYGINPGEYLRSIK